MLSQQEFIDEILENIYPMATDIENRCLDLFNKQFSPGRGQTGLTGTNELDQTIQYLQSSICFLRRLAKEQHIEVSE